MAEQWQNRLVDHFNRAEDRYALEDEAAKVRMCDGTEPTQVQAFLKEMELVAPDHRLSVFNRTARGSLLRTGLQWVTEHQDNPVWMEFRAHLMRSFVSPDAQHAQQRELRSCSRLPGEAILSYNRRFSEIADDAYPAPRNAEQTSILIQEYARGLRDDRLKEKIVTPNRPDALHIAMQRVQAVETKQDNLAWLGINHEPMEVDAVGPFSRNAPSALEKEVHVLKVQYGKLESKIDRLLQLQQAPSPKEDVPRKETRVCYNCNRPGHFSRECKEPRRNAGRRPRGQGSSRRPSGNPRPGVASAAPPAP